MTPVSTPKDHIVIERVFDAPLSLVWRAWSEAEQLLQWYAPQGCTVTIHELDFRVGGIFRTCINHPRHGPCHCKGTYTIIQPMETLAWTMGFCDEQGNRVSSEDAKPGQAWPTETTVTLTFKEAQGKTVLTLHQTVSETLAKASGAYDSWHQMLDKLNHLVRL